MGRFAQPDLTGLTAPNVVETLDYEAILQALKDDVVTRMALMGVDYDVAMLESDPVVKVLEVAAYREVLLRARVNTAARAIMLAYAQQGDLEQLGVYYGVERETGELDDRLRERIQYAPEALSVAGPDGAYVFHAMAADPTVKTVHVYSPVPGEVHVIPLVSTGDGIPGTAVLDKIRQRLSQLDVRPLTDNVQVTAPWKLEFSVDLTIDVTSGPDPVLVKTAAAAAVNAYLASRFMVGLTVARSGIIAAAHVSGVENVTLTLPTADIVPANNQVAYKTALIVRV